MAPLVHMVFRQSRTLRDVIVMSCMLDLAQCDVATATDLAVARAEQLLRAVIGRFKASLLAWHGPGYLLRASRRRLKLLLPMLILVGWFALPMGALAGVCAALVSIELSITAP